MKKNTNISITMRIVVGLIFDIVSTSSLTSKKPLKNENK